MCLEILRKTTNVSIACFPAANRNGQLPTTSLERYHYLRLRDDNLIKVTVNGRYVAGNPQHKKHDGNCIILPISGRYVDFFVQTKQYFLRLYDNPHIRSSNLTEPSS
jgi:hypothetical protein